MTLSYTTNLCLRWCMLALLLIVSLSGCVVPVPMPPATPTSVEGEVLPFEIIVQAVAQCETYDPEVRLLFVTTAEEFDQLVAQLPAPNDSSIRLDALPDIDFTSHAVMIAVRSCQGYGGSDIVISRVIRLAGEALTVYIELREPRPDVAVPAVSGSSFHIITIPWDGPGADQAKVELVTYGTNY